MAKVIGNDVREKYNFVLQPWLWVWYILSRVSSDRKLAFVVMFTARPGKGKSWSSLALATLVDKTFVQCVKENGIASRVAHKVSELGRMMREERVKPGTCFILEEGGVSASSKDSMNRAMRAYEKILQVARYKRLIVIINAPYASLYIKVGRSLLDAEFKVMSRSGDWNIIRPLQYNLVEDDNMHKEFLIKKTLFDEYKINRLWLPKPPQVVIDAYDLYERSFKQQIIDDAVAQMEEVERLCEEKKVAAELDPNLPNTVCVKCGCVFKRSQKRMPMRCPSSECKGFGNAIRELSSLTPVQRDALPKLNVK
jgi:predicted Zn-ribbon and HTH transcriptional regulator